MLAKAALRPCRPGALWAVCRGQLVPVTLACSLPGRLLHSVPGERSNGRCNIHLQA